MPKPSEQIRNLVPAIAQGRLRKARAEMRQQGVPTLLMSAAEERMSCEMLAQDPMTWVMAILGYLDGKEIIDAEASVSNPEQSNG